MIRVIRGNPDAAELAAVTLVLLAAVRRPPPGPTETAEPHRAASCRDPRAAAAETPWIRDARHRRTLAARAFEGDGHL